MTRRGIRSSVARTARLDERAPAVGSTSGHASLCRCRGGCGRALAGVARLFVVPAARGSGLAAALLDTAVAHARLIGRPVMLDVVEGSGAVDFYERLGWRLVDRRRATWTGPHGVPPIVPLYLPPFE